MNTEVLFSRKSDLWRTPVKLFEQYNRIYKFDLDGAACAADALCDTWFGPGGLEEDALACEWHKVAPYARCVWLNPPYSRVDEFVEKAAEEAAHGITTVMLLPARTDTQWFHKWLYCKPNVTIKFLKGRVKYLNDQGEVQSSAPFPSMIVIVEAVHG